MSLHPSTFEYLKPTEAQIEAMSEARGAAALYVATVAPLLPEGPDKTYLMRKFREVAMWVNIAITRLPDGTPRVDVPASVPLQDPPEPLVPKSTPTP